MSQFVYRDGVMHAEAVPLPDIADQFGTPVYVYSRAVLESNWQQLDTAFTDRPHLICYAVKANSNIAVLNCLARLGSGFDIVSAGELARVIRAGGDPARTVFSGVGKTAEELRFALKHSIKCFNVESINELNRLHEVAKDLKQSAPVSLRVNPDIDAKTHPYIATGLKENKFGTAIELAKQVYLQAAEMDYIQIVGVDCHIGSQITDISPFKDALERILILVDALSDEDIQLHHIDIGGGLGITYEKETPPAAGSYAEAIQSVMGERKPELIIEPGRSIVGNAGLLITRVEYLNVTPYHHFAVVDAAMNDLLRPSLYGGWHNITRVVDESDAEEQEYDVVGPVCETGDFLGKNRKLKLAQGDLLAVHSAGAYGFSMASNYNSRPRIAELMVDGNTTHLIRPRESVEDLMRGESILPE